MLPGTRYCEVKLCVLKVGGMEFLEIKRRDHKSETVGPKWRERERVHSEVVS